MPEPNYASGDGPGLVAIVVSAVVVFLLLALLKSCVWG